MHIAFEWTYFLCKPDISTSSALPPTPKSLDLEALRRASCRSVKNFLEEKIRDGLITSTICSGWTTMPISGQWSRRAKMGWSGTGAKDLPSFHNHRCRPGRWTLQRCRLWKPWSRHQTIGRRCLTSSKQSLSLLSSHIQVVVINDWHHFIEW